MMKERIRSGGLMRCCTQTLYEERQEPVTPPVEGQVIRCRWCPDSMVFHDGAWEWNRPQPPG